MDARCLFGTFFKVLRHEDVHEGGPDAALRTNDALEPERELATV